jgi:hypothetical protein
MDWLSVAILIAGVLVIWVIDTHPRIMAHLPSPVIRFVITEDKTTLHPFRLLSILALPWLVVRLVPKESGWLRARLASPFVLIGQHSLPVFCAGSCFGFIARLGLESEETARMQIAVNLFGAVGMVLVGAVAAWYRSKGRAERPQRAQAAHALPVIARTDSG